MLHHRLKYFVNSASSALIATAGLFSTVSASVGAPPSSYQVLHVFNQKGGGVKPITGVTGTSDTELFGTTTAGGANNLGSIFLLKTSDDDKTWTEQIIFSFTGAASGSLPGSALFINHKGDLLASTVMGGATNRGTLFRLDRPTNGSKIWTEDVLADFTDLATGEDPLGDLLVRPDGTILGTTVIGGAFNQGAIFQAVLSEGETTATETVLLSFNGTLDGFAPHDGIIEDRAGHFFGTATGGGQFADGLVFQFTPPAGSARQWTAIPIFVFDSANGSLPFGGLLAFKGSLFGVTFQGGPYNQGVVYQLIPPTQKGEPWTETILHVFTGGTDGGSPESRLSPDGDGGFYGTAASAGTGGLGNIFHLTPPTEPGGSWTLTPLHQFAGGDDGGAPSGDLLKLDGAIFGTTQGTSSSTGTVTSSGTVYRVVP
jgi:uncharacterized repeat protein (TIGR03803 family)